MYMYVSIPPHFSVINRTAPDSSSLASCSRDVHHAYFEVPFSANIFRSFRRRFSSATIFSFSNRALSMIAACRLRGLAT